MKKIILILIILFSFVTYSKPKKRIERIDVTSSGILVNRSLSVHLPKNRFFVGYNQYYYVILNKIGGTNSFSFSLDFYDYGSTAAGSRLTLPLGKDLPEDIQFQPEKIIIIFKHSKIVYDSDLRRVY